MLLLTAKLFPEAPSGRTRHAGGILSIVLCAILATSCATVPQQSVELSNLIGRDIGQLKQSYDLLIVNQFADFRSRRIDYLENVWTPEFIKTWVEDGKLKQVARGEKVFDENLGEFTTPTAGREQQQLLETILMWSTAAIEQIDEKRAKLIGPLDKQEVEVRAEAAAAFDRIIQANAQVTAHLSSIRDVKEAQSEVLEQLGAKDVVDDLNKRLIDLSNLADEGLTKMREVDGNVDKAIDIRESISDNI